MWNNFFSSGYYPTSFNTWSSDPAPSSSSSGSLRVVNPDPGDRNASAVCSIATVSGVSYAKAWNVAIDHGFSQNSGMDYSEIKATLDELGVSCTHHSGSYGWKDLPDLAMITVSGESSSRHVVVFERQSRGKGSIYDSEKNHPARSESYTLVKRDGYLEIRNQSSHTSNDSAPSYSNYTPQPSYYTPPSPTYSAPSSYYPPSSSYYPPSSSYYTPSSSNSSSNLRIVHQEPGDGSACAVCAIAVVSGVSYRKAWNTAIDHGFHRNKGMNAAEIKATLDELGVSTSYRTETPSWDDLPDLAIVSVRGQSGGLHAVVFERRANGGNYIYDNYNHYPVGPEYYTLLRNEAYVKINKGAGGSYA